MSGYNPEFEKRLNSLLAKAKEKGMNVDVQMGIRTFEKQNELFKQGRTKPGKIVTNAPGGLSWHNYGLAADIVFKDEKGNWSWGENWPWDQLGALGKESGLEWGGDWKKFPDRPHFQLTNGLGIRSALRMYQQGGLGRVWLEIEKGLT